MVEQPGTLRFLMGSAVMLVGVMAPLMFLMFRNKKGFNSMLGKK